MLPQKRGSIYLNSNGAADKPGVRGGNRSSGRRVEPPALWPEVGNLPHAMRRPFRLRAPSWNKAQCSVLGGMPPGFRGRPSRHSRRRLEACDHNPAARVGHQIQCSHSRRTYRPGARGRLPRLRGPQAGSRSGWWSTPTPDSRCGSHARSPPPEPPVGGEGDHRGDAESGRATSGGARRTQEGTRRQSQRIVRAVARTASDLISHMMSRLLAPVGRANQPSCSPSDFRLFRQRQPGMMIRRALSSEDTWSLRSKTTSLPSSHTR